MYIKFHNVFSYIDLFKGDAQFQKTEKMSTITDDLNHLGLDCIFFI